MAAPRKITQPVTSNSGDTTTATDDEKATVSASESTSEQTPAPATSTEQAAVIDTTDGEQHTGELPVSAIVEVPSNIEQVTLLKEVGGHDKGASITVTRGAADYLREQGYVESDEDDED